MTIQLRTVRPGKLHLWPALSIEYQRNPAGIMRWGIVLCFWRQVVVLIVQEGQA